MYLPLHMQNFAKDFVNTNSNQSWYCAADSMKLLELLKQQKSLNVTWTLIESDFQLQKELQQAKSCQWRAIAVDTETNGLDPTKHKVELLQIAYSVNEPVLLIRLAKISNLEPIKKILANPQIIKVLQNASFDRTMLEASGIELLEPVVDTMLGYQILTRGTKVKTDLQTIVSQLLNLEISKAERASDWRAETLSSQQLSYAATDALVLIPALETITYYLEQENLTQVAEDEYRISLAVSRMARRGIKIDLERWASTREDLVRQKQAAATQIYNRLGEHINIRSPKALLQKLQGLGYELKSTSSEALVPLARDDSLIQQILRYRSLSTRISTFFDAFPQKIGPDHRIRGNWIQLATSTGRIGCKKPNLVNIPRDKATRNCFVAKDGYQLIKADYSQIELRLMAVITQAQNLIEAFIKGLDIHSLTASSIFGLLLELVTSKERQLGKITNLGLIYGMGAKKFQYIAAKDYGVYLSSAECEALIAGFFEAYPEIKAFHQRKAVEQHTQRTSFALDGRRRMWMKKPELMELINNPAQSTCASIIKKAIYLWEQASISIDAQLILVKYDELVIEAKSEIASLAAAILQQVMVEAAQPYLNPVPAVVDLQIADSWGGG